MAYLGKSPTGTGVRQRYYFTATGGETTLGASVDDNGLTLSYSDGAYVDVLLNGIELVAGTDYNTNTANRISGLAALAASDVVTVTVYDIFTVADTVSAKDGGTFSGNVGLAGNDLILDADADSKIEASTDDTINIISGGTTGLTVDSSGYVTTPVNPKFSTQLAVANAAADYTSVATTAVPIDTEDFDIGNCITISSDVATFTAPVTGYYQFNLVLNLQSAGLATTVSTYFNVNGALTSAAQDEAYRHLQDPEDGAYVASTNTALIYVQSGQTVVPHFHVGSDTSTQVRDGTRFSGFLVP